MATKAYYTWVDAGEPWRLATPIKELQAWARANGITVLGTLGDDDHLTAEPPLDHTPFSSTPWPIPLPGYVVTAIDLANVPSLGQRIRDLARDGKAPWLKYLIYANQSYSHRDGFRESGWDSDTHVHISIRSDWCDRSIGSFDPLGGTVDAEDVKALWQYHLAPEGYNMQDHLMNAEKQAAEANTKLDKVAADLAALTEVVKRLAERPTAPLPTQATIHGEVEWA